MLLFAGGLVSGCVRGSITLYLLDTIATTIFAKSLSNFTCKLGMMRKGTLLILGHRVKGQGQLWHSVYKTLWTWYILQFLSNHFQEEEPYWFWVTGSKVKVNSPFPGHGVKGQGQSPLPHWGCHSLRCLVIVWYKKLEDLIPTCDSLWVGNFKKSYRLYILLNSAIQDTCPHMASNFCTKKKMYYTCLVNVFMCHTGVWPEGLWGQNDSKYP